MGKNLVVYVAGPLTTGNLPVNCRLAMEAGRRLKAAGYTPIVPHVMVLQELVTGDHDYEGWIEWCLRILERCDAMVRLPGPSSGADREEEHARWHNIPVLSECEMY